jgi:hypothetical protein
MKEYFILLFIVILGVWIANSISAYFYKMFNSSAAPITESMDNNKNKNKPTTKNKKTT